MDQRRMVRSLEAEARIWLGLQERGAVKVSGRLSGRGRNK